MSKGPPGPADEWPPIPRAQGSLRLIGLFQFQLSEDRVHPFVPPPPNPPHDLAARRRQAGRTR